MTGADASELTPEEARAALTNAETRQGAAWFGPCVEVLWRGEWWQLCRTDLKDNVATSPSNMDGAPDPVAAYREAIRYGARLMTHDGLRLFAVIDRFSDG